jgi:hypothetical protein
MLSETDRPGRAARLAAQSKHPGLNIGPTFEPRETIVRYVVGFGGTSPKYFITICKSFQASPFCRGSRRRNAG